MLEDVLDRERVDVDDDRLQPRLFHDCSVVVDLVLLRRNEEEIHLAGFGPSANTSRPPHFPQRSPCSAIVFAAAE